MRICVILLLFVCAYLLVQINILSTDRDRARCETVEYCDRGYFMPDVDCEKMRKELCPK